MSNTKSALETEQKISGFANGKDVVYEAIAEYDQLPKVDRREYVMRLLALYQVAMHGAKQREGWVNDCNRKLADTNRTLMGFTEELNQQRQDLKRLRSFEKTIWFRLYKWFNGKG